MPTSVDIKNLKINKLTEAQYDAAVQGGVIGENELSVLTDADIGGLPDQTGQAGKFLTTDGTDASWNNRTHELIIASRDNVSETGELAFKTNNMYNSSRIAFYKTNGTYASGIFYATAGSAEYSGIAVSANNYQYYRFCPTHFGTNSDNYFALGAPGLRWSKVYTNKINNGADINVPTTGGTLALTSDLPSTPAIMPELTVAGWSNNTQTVSVSGVTASNVVIVGPAPASASDYASAGILCVSQATDSLTFQCDTVPTNAITVNVVIF